MAVGGVVASGVNLLPELEERVPGRGGGGVSCITRGLGERNGGDKREIESVRGILLSMGMHEIINYLLLLSFLFFSTKPTRHIYLC